MLPERKSFRKTKMRSPKQRSRLWASQAKAYAMPFQHKKAPLLVTICIASRIIRCIPFFSNTFHNYYLFFCFLRRGAKVPHHDFPIDPRASNILGCATKAPSIFPYRLVYFLYQSTVIWSPSSQPISSTHPKSCNFLLSMVYSASR
jgi:hypothetical protein